MSNQNLLEELQTLSDQHFQTEIDEIIEETVDKMRDKAKIGLREAKCVTGSKKASELIMKHFESQKFKCEVYYNPKEDYGDMDTYDITIKW